MAREVVVRFRPPGPMLSMNQGDTWDTRQTVAAWRERAAWAWIEAHPGKGPTGRTLYPAHVYTSLPFDQPRRRDPINWARTVKAIVDGLTDAGAWPDDTPEYVTQHIPTCRVEHGGDVILRVTADQERSP